MFDVLGMLRTATAAAGGVPFGLAAPYDLSEYHCRELVRAGDIESFVLPRPPGRSQTGPEVCGWWTDRVAGRWHLCKGAPQTLLVVGARLGQRLTGQMLLEARLMGVRRVLLADCVGAIVAEIDTTVEILRQLGGPSGRLYGENSIEQVFEKIREELGDVYRLPADAFVPNRLLLLASTLGPGGAERQITYTSTGLMRTGRYEVTVACINLDSPNDHFQPEVERSGAQVCRVPAGDPAYDTPRMLDFRNRLAVSDNLGAQNLLYQILHYVLLVHRLRPTWVYSFLDYSNVLGGLAAEIVGVPHLMISGRSVATDQFPQIYQPYMKPGYRCLLKHRRLAFLNNSAAGARDYARWLEHSEDEFRIVHNGFIFPDPLPPETRAAVRSQHGIPDDAFVLGTITRFSEEKNPRLFVETAVVLSRRYPDMRFLAFGAGPQWDELRASVAAQGASATIVLAGPTSNAWGALAAMDAFALTSRMEGLSNVLVEAQAMELPVVCTGVGGMPETYEEGRSGFSILSQGPEDLADAVGRLYEDPELRAGMSRRASEYVRERFTIDRMLKNTLACYDELITADKEAAV